MSGAARDARPAWHVDAVDEAAVVVELLELLYWAAEGIGDSHSAAIARGAMIAKGRADRLHRLLKEAGGGPEEEPR